MVCLAKKTTFATMRKVLYSLFIVGLSLTSVKHSNAQYKWDFGARVGISNYLGDMGGNEKTRRDFIADMKLNQSRWVLGGFARYRLNNLFAVNAGLTYARIQGDDAKSTNPGRRGRNLHFRNDLLELYARGELFFLEDNDVGNRGRYQVDFQAYGFAGLAGVMHGPKAQLNGKWVALRPLQTEGVKYGLFTFGMPVGFGFFFTQKRKHRFGFEMQWTPTFTDYLDDVSTVFADPAKLGSPEAIELSSGRDKLPLLAEGIPPIENYLPGEKRGDNTHNDNYLFAAFTYSYLVRGYSTFYTQHYGWLGGRKRAKKRNVRAKF